MISYIENDSFTILQNIGRSGIHVLKVSKLSNNGAVMLNAIERGTYDIEGDELEINKRSDIILTYDKFREFVNNCLLLIEDME